MANDELMKPENHDYSFRQDQFTGIPHNDDLFSSDDYNSAFDQILDVNLQIGDSCEDYEVWNHFQGHKVINLKESRIHKDDTKERTGFYGNQNDGYLSFTENDDSGTPETNKSTVIRATDAIHKQESQEIDDNLDLGMGHSMEYSQKPDMAPSSLHCLSMPSPVTDHEMVVGMEFPDAYACRRAMRDIAISQRFEMQTIKSDKTRFTAKCISKGCPWRVHCAKLPHAPNFTIRTIHGSHTCGGISHLGHQQASVHWVADVVAEKLKENPYFKPKQILEEIHRVHGIALSYKQAWRGKERLMASLRGSFEEEYSLLPQYCDEIKRTNPGSTAVVHVNPVDGTFQQLFISFQASISGFLNACLPLIALDKTFLKSKYPGTLLVASGFDGDGAVFPLAFAIVNEENDCNWHRFLSELRKILEIKSDNMPKLTILSCRDRSIIDGVKANFPTAFHGLCVYHLTELFQQEFQSSILVNLLWEAAHSLTVLEFKSKLNNIQQISPEASLWIQNIPPVQWASSYFEGTRFGHFTANIITESFSKWIEDTAGLPIIRMMECIHRHLMNLFNERREMSVEWSDLLVPSAERQMLAATEQSRVHRVYRANETKFEVMTPEGNVVVDIKNRSCLCCRWQSFGLPCSHAVGALLSCKEDVYKYTESCFTVENYRKTYAKTVEPVSDKAEWKRNDSERDGKNVIRTPKVMRSAPRKRRIRAEDRDRIKRAVRCSRCNQLGHFRTTCTAPM